MALVVLASCNKKELLPVAYINVAEGSTFTPAEVSAEGAEVAINFSTNYQWQIRGYSTLGFCSIDVLKGEAGDAGIVVTVDPNTTGVVRSAEFSILAGAAVQTVTITQTETNSVAVDAVNYTVPAEGGTVEIVVSHNVDYVVNIPSEYTTWIREVPQSKVMQTSYVTLEVDSNPEWIERTATGLTITGKDVFGNDIVNEFSITQPVAIETIWNKTFSTDWTSIEATTPSHLAMFDGKLLVSNATGIHAVDPLTGEYKEKVEIPGLSVAPESMASDDAGNVIFAANANMNMFTVYMYDGESVKSIAEYNGANLNGYNIGNMRVVGDLKSNAVITAIGALWGNPAYYIAWQVKGGVAENPVVGKVTPTTDPSNIAYACVSPVSADLSDGLVFCGYAGDPYALYYCADPVTEQSWTTVFDFQGAWNTNFSCISIAEYNGTRYCAVGESWFGGNTPTAFLLDITDISKVELMYKDDFSGIWEADPMGNDIKLTVQDGIMRLYIVNPLSDMAACVEFSH